MTASAARSETVARAVVDVAHHFLAGEPLASKALGCPGPSPRFDCARGDREAVACSLRCQAGEAQPATGVIGC
eukprot:7966711-Alexandrium_andersonii.AAC.1